MLEGGGQAVDARQEVVRGVVQKPRAAVAIHPAVPRQQRAVRLRDDAQAVGRLHLLGGAIVRQHLLVGQQFPPKDRVGQCCAIERVLTQGVAEFAARGHETAFDVEKRAIRRNRALNVLIGDFESKLLRRQQRPAVESLE